MKRVRSSSSSDSLGGFMSICPNSTDEGGNNPMYAKELQSMMEGMEEEESGHVSEKKRRLSVEQVKALEKNFEVENKLEPERKVKLAQDLGLQPRQVAVWFQNRRARWKTKQLETDYGGLKSTYDALKLDFDRLHRDNESLLKQIRELKSKLDGDGDVEEEEEKTKIDGGAAAGNSVDCGRKEEIWPKFGDGSSDSDSSAILNEENNNNNNNNGMCSTNVGFEVSPSPQMVKIEEHNFFGEESCSTLFSDDQAPSLHWYCNDQWN